MNGIEDRRGSVDGGLGEGSDVYRALQPVSESEQVIVGREAYAAQAADVLATVRNHDRDTARGAYIVEEENPRLRQLSEAVLGAGDVYKNSARLDELRLSRDPDSRSERRKLEQERRSYLTQVRQLAIDARGEVRHEELESWLTEASGDPVWVREALSEVGAGSVVYGVLSRMPGVEAVQLGTFEGGEHDHEMVVQVNWDRDRSFPIDVTNAADRSTDDMVEQGRDAIKVTVPASVLGGFRMQPEAKAALTERLATMLDVSGEEMRRAA